MEFLDKLTFLHDAANWAALSFVVFVAFTGNAIRKAIVAKLDGRIASVRSEIETAQTLRAEAQAIYTDYQKRLAEATQEAKNIVANARKHADSIRKESEAALEETLKRREAQLKERLARMEESAFQQVRAHAADLAVKATAEIIAKTMDEKAAARLIDTSIGEVATQLH